MFLCGDDRLGRGCRAGTIADQQFDPQHGILHAAALVTLMLTAVTATVALVAAVPRYREMKVAQERLVEALDAHQVRAMYTDYWTCNRVAFASHLRIVCTVVNDDLTAGLNRIPGFTQRVRATPSTAYVFAQGSAIDSAFAARSGGTTPISAGGYHIYLGLPTGLTG